MKRLSSGVPPCDSSGALSWGDMDTRRPPCAPFPHRFAQIDRRVDCGTPWQSATRKARLWTARLPRPLGGREGRGAPRRRSGDGVWRVRTRVLGRSVQGGHARSCVALLGLRSSLGTGGAVVSCASNQLRSAGGVDCQVPQRSECLSLRGGAAGPEWSRAPGTSTLALGQRLGQLSAYVFAHFDVSRRSRSTRLSSDGRPYAPAVAHLRVTGRVSSFRSETRIAGRRGGLS